MMRAALEKWNALPAADKTAKVPDHGKPDPKYHHSLPDKASVIKVFTRALEQKQNSFTRLSENIPGRLAAVDHLWLQQQELNEIHQLMQSGGGLLPKRLASRIARYHFVDSTRGEPPFWKTNEIKNFHFKIARNGKVAGTFHLETPDSKRGYQGTFEGHIKFSKSGQLTDFQLLAQGKHWGEGRYTRGARPGKTPLGIYLQFIATPKPADLIPPQAIHWPQGYWQADQ